MRKEFRFLFFFLPLMLSPVLGYGSPRPIDFSRHEGASGITASVQYKPAIPYFGGFSIGDSSGKTLKTYAAKKEGDVDGKNSESFVESKYDPRYERSTDKFSVSLGYSTGMIRFEAEGLYHEFIVDKANFSNVKNAQTFAMSKSDTQAAASSSSASAGSSPAKPSNTLPDYYVTATNEGISVTSLLGNVCYDIIPAEIKLSPSVCAGAGMSFIKFLGVTNRRTSYQGKVGIQYFLSSRSVIFASAYVHKIVRGKFEKIPVTHHKKPATAGGNTNTNAIEHLYPSANLETAYLGVECGIRLIFSL
ncbi:P44/Msp2 family outer membrane protein [Anaplasma bovis]|uniref:P44/Msp2 family outer membrane protein n=1 Tax=Anaplasma bovis TaxID=186733 RepID=UPI002FF02165